MNILSAEVDSAVSTAAWFAHCGLLLPYSIPIPNNYHLSSSFPRIYQLKEWGRICGRTSGFGTTWEGRGYWIASNTQTSELQQVGAASNTQQCLCWPQSLVWKHKELKVAEEYCWAIKKGGRSSVLLRPIRFRCSGVWIWTGILCI